MKHKAGAHSCTASVLILILTYLLLTVPGYAGVTGKISGIVTDLETGDPLVGATVRVESTNLATTTDEDGEYFIIGVPVGKYNVSVTHVGFENIIKKGVRVLLDLTTPVDFDLVQMTIQLDQEVVVMAGEPLIKKDLTESKVIFTADRLRNLPNIVSVQAVLNNYPGVVIDGSDQLHVRGGRSGQVTYYYDGFSVEDPFVLNSGIRIMPSALEELSLTSGGFTAEYGDALSGIVSAVTREGTQQYHGSIRTYEELTHPYMLDEADWGSLDNLGDRSLSFDISGPIPGLDSRRYTFFGAGEYLRQTGSLPHNWGTAYTGIAKITVRPTNNLKLKTNLTYYEADGAVYDHRDVNGVSFDFNLDGLPLFEKKAYLAGVSGTYSVSSSTIMSAHLNHFMTRTHSAPQHLMGKHWSEWPGYPDEIYLDNYGNGLSTSDPYEIVGFAMGDRYDPTYRFRETKYNSASVNVVSQIDKVNQIKAGFEYRRYDVFWDFKQFYNVNPYGETYSSKPVYGSFFVQDKIEYRDFVINAGMRYDYNNSDISYNSTPEDTVAKWVKATSKSRWSPRIGMSFPISEKSVMHFNYGIYFQAPAFTYLYTNLQGDISSGLPLLGNPELEPEETISYELGLDHLIGDHLRLDVTAYYKDIQNLVTTRELQALDNLTVTKFENEDYGSVKGVDLALEYLPGDNLLSGSISYGYMIATGIGSDALEPYYTYITDSRDTLPPLKEYALDFDQRHTITAVADFRVPRHYQKQLLGVSVPDAWGLTAVGYYGSGLPYTKTDVNGNRINERNDSRLPANYRVDMRLNKDFYIGKGDNFLTLFIEVDNLFNRRNILNVYSSTGRPDYDSYTPQGGLALDSQQLADLDRLYDHDPLNFSLPRTVRIGTEFNF
ncbi:TonB-dependent receptor [bacterium]|nr:TonB-dependent receptor [bacterium]